MSNANEVRFVDTTLRDGNQSLWALAMSTSMMLPVASRFNEAGFAAVELTAPAHFKTIVRELREDPWERIRLMSREVTSAPLAVMQHCSIIGFRIVPTSLAQLWMQRLAANGIRRAQVHRLEVQVLLVCRPHRAAGQLHEVLGCHTNEGDVQDATADIIARAVRLPASHGDLLGAYAEGHLAGFHGAPGRRDLHGGALDLGHEEVAIPANVGYHGYPKTILTSVNQVVCHGIPSATKILKEGDIINIDVAVIKDGWFGDTSRMFFVGAPSVAARRLVETTYEALRAAIHQVKPGATLGDIGHAIQSVAQAAHFSVVREYCGHGIGQIYHDEPQVLHYGQRAQEQRICLYWF